MTWLESALQCPDCANQIGPRDDGCGSCGRTFQRTGRQLDLRPLKSESLVELEVGSKFRGHAAELKGWRRRLWERLYDHPIRFIDDRQETHGKNAHDRVLRFASSAGRAVVDIGSGDRRLLPSILTTDLAAGDEIDIRLDAHNLPFRTATLDGVILQHVLEHVADPARVLNEVNRVLQPRGRLYVEVPFLFPVHSRVDYRRWTVSGLERDLPAGLSSVEHGLTIGPFTTLSALVRATATHRVRNPYAAFAVDVVLGWLVAPVRALDTLVSVSPESQICAGAVYVIAERDG